MQAIPSTVGVESLNLIVRWHWVLLAEPTPNANKWKDMAQKLLEKVQNMKTLQRNRIQAISENGKLIFPSPIVDIIRCYAEAQQNWTLPSKS